MPKTADGQENETERVSKIVWLQQKLLSYFPLIVLLLVIVIWVSYYRIGFSSFNKINAVSIFGSVIQGMSALLSVAIAVIIFRIQSLENRNQQLEESTLNFIFQTTRSAYPKWIPSVEEDIRSRTLTKKYYGFRVDRLNRTIGIADNPDYYKAQVKRYKKDRNTQQKRLEETLNVHTRTEQTIQQVRDGVINSTIMLIIPILLSFLLLMVSDAFDVSFNFVFVSTVVFMSASGIAVLIKTVLESTVK